MFGDSYHLTFVYHDSPSHGRLCRLSPVHGNVRAFARTAEGSVCEENAATPAQVSAKLHLQSPGNVRMYRPFRIRGEAHTAHAPQLVSVLASLCHVRGRMCKSVRLYVRNHHKGVANGTSFVQSANRRSVCCCWQRRLKMLSPLRLCSEAPIL